MFENAFFFSNIFFDGFDSDFSQGQVRQTEVRNAGNDGLDFSGSIVHIEDCWVQDCRDKGISVGEESDLTIFSTTIKNANVAIASKDLSVVYGKEIKVENCDQAFVAYQKKVEYGPGKMIIETYETENVKRLHAATEGSSIQLGDQLFKN